MNTKLRFVLLLTLIMNAAVAQKLQFSPKEFDKDAVLRFLGEGTESLYYFKIPYDNMDALMANGADIEQFDFSLGHKREILRKTYMDLSKKKQFYIGMPKIFNNKITWLTKTGSSFGPFALTIYQPFDNVESVPLDTLHATHAAFDLNYPYLKANKNGQLLVSSNWHALVKQNREDQYFYLVDKNLRNITPKKEFNNGKSADNEKRIIEGLYNNFLITSNPFGVYNIEKEQFSYMDQLKTPDDVEDGTHFTYFDGENNRLTYSFLYKQKKTTYKHEIFSGHFYCAYDLTTGKIISSKNTLFDENTVTELSRIKTDKGSENAVSAAFTTQDGGSIYIVDNYDPGEPGGYEKEFNIYFVSISNTGKFNWIKTIVRNEKISPRKGRTDWDSYAAIKLKSDVIHILLNEEDKVVDYSVDQKGTIDKKILFGEENDAASADMFIFPKYSYHKSDSEIIMPCMKNKKVSLLQVTY